MQLGSLALSLAHTTSHYTTPHYITLHIARIQEYLFFPAKSRFTFKGVDKEDAERLDARCNEVVRAELDLSRIRPGLGAPGEGVTQRARKEREGEGEEGQKACIVNGLCPPQGPLDCCSAISCAVLCCAVHQHLCSLYCLVFCDTHSYWRDTVLSIHVCTTLFR